MATGKPHSDAEHHPPHQQHQQPLQQNFSGKTPMNVTPSNSLFGCTVRELKDLMEFRGLDAVARLRNKYGTTDELCRRLLVQPTEGEPC